MLNHVKKPLGAELVLGPGCEQIVASRAVRSPQLVIRAPRDKMFDRGAPQTRF